LLSSRKSKGYEATSVRDLGRLSLKDWDLLNLILEGDWTLVTSNVVEFRKRYRSQTELHAGVVFLEGVDAGRDTQRAAFSAALTDVDAAPSIVNQEILVTPAETGGYTVRRFDLP
jgi:uncharacterized protein DUF5615